MPFASYRIILVLFCLCFTPSMMGAGICDGFKITLKNHLAQDLLVAHITINHADLTPPYLDTINARSEGMFTILNAERTTPIVAEMSLYTVSIPSKKMIIRFVLEDKGVYCSHSDKSSSEEHQISSARVFGKGVDYSIDD